MNIYVASSWRNERQPAVVELLRVAGHSTYDFRNPAEGVGGFHWSEIDQKWKDWTPEQFRHGLDHKVAKAGFAHDWRAMRLAHACVPVLPCGRSAHLEAGYFVGAKKPLLILLADGEPELMYRMADHVCVSTDELIDRLGKVEEEMPVDEKIKLLTCATCHEVLLVVERSGNLVCPNGHGGSQMASAGQRKAHRKYWKELTGIGGVETGKSGAEA